MLKKSDVREKYSCLFLSLIVFVGTICFHSSDLYAQQNGSATEQEQALRVFIDQMDAYRDYLTEEITYVNFVRDRTLAQVHVLMTSLNTGSGGTEYTLTLTGLQNFVGINDTLTYDSMQMDTTDTRRQGLLDALTLGLVQYVIKTPLKNRIVVIRREQTETKTMAPSQVTDKWNYWVFNISTGSMRWTGETSRKTMSISPTISIDRVTEKWKLNYVISSSDQITKNKLTVTDPVTKIKSTVWDRAVTSNRVFLRWTMIRSLSSHWSLAFHGAYRKSTLENFKLRVVSASALEYNVFPYSQSTRREFIFDAEVENDNLWYYEETVYNKTKEYLVYGTLSTSYNARERWGTLSIAASAASYLHDLDKYRIGASCTLSFRILAGLSLDVSGSYSRINDQLNLRKRGVTDKEALLNLIQRATSFSTSESIGLRYTFGSIYNNVVNPRFPNSL